MGNSLRELGRFSEAALLILISLAAGDKHGYAIMEDVERTAGVRLGPGTLYGAIARLEQRGLIAAQAAQDRRRPYRLTAAGAAALHEQLSDLQRLASEGLARLAGS